MYIIPLAAFLFLDPKRDEESEESGDLMKWVLSLLLVACIEQDEWVVKLYWDNFYYLPVAP